MKPILGTMRLANWGANFNVAQTEAYLEQAAALGIECLDTADIYSDHQSNALVGKVFAKRPDLRRHFKIIGKIAIRMPHSPYNRLGLQYYDSSLEHLQGSLEQMLSELTITTVDQLLIHRVDLLWQVDEIAAWAQQQMAAGKLAALGISNANTEQLALLQSRLPLCAHQLELSLAAQDALAAQVPQAQQYGIKVQAYSPLPKYEVANQSHAEMLDVSQRFAQELGLSLAALWQRWAASVPGVQIISGTTQIARLRDAVLACDQPLPRDIWYALLVAARGKAMP